MKATLYKLKEGYILAYDNLTRESFIESWLSMGKSIICHGGKTRGVLTKSPDFSLLSDEDAKRIGWFDVEKIVIPISLKYAITKNGQPDKTLVAFGIDVSQKALELTADRRFTEDDMQGFVIWLDENWRRGKSGWRHVGDFYKNHKPVKTESLMQKYLESISQHKSWEVEYKEENGGFKILKLL